MATAADYTSADYSSQQIVLRLLTRPGQRSFSPDDQGIAVGKFDLAEVPHAEGIETEIRAPTERIVRREFVAGGGEAEHSSPLDQVGRTIQLHSGADGAEPAPRGTLRPGPDPGRRPFSVPLDPQPRGSRRCDRFGGRFRGCNGGSHAIRPTGRSRREEDARRLSGSPAPRALPAFPAPENAGRRAGPSIAGPHPARRRRPRTPSIPRGRSSGARRAGSCLR
jgi:hypothetical protein